MAQYNLKHGSSNTSTYFSWKAMKSRCYNQNNNRYHAYGGRGIQVCDRWRNSFADFLADMGQKPLPRCSIERLNNDGNYEPGNCVWSTSRLQSRNTGRNKMVVVNGQLMCYADADAALGLPRNTVGKRIRRGATPQQAVAIPLTRTRRHDLTGKRFGRLTVVESAGHIPGPQPGQRYPLWKCLCDCGGTRIVRADVLKRGTTKSCGCLIGRNQYSKDA